MKKCPFCAEEIQEEAIICRFCGRDLPVAPEPIKAQGSTRFEILPAYERFFTSLRAAILRDRVHYPLSADRRPQVIANIVTRVEAASSELNFVHVLNHYVWWHTGIDKKKNPAYVWQEEAQRLLAISSADPLFPTEEEWLSAVAMILFRADKGGYAPPRMFPLDWPRVWEGLQKAKRIDKRIRGLTLIGALGNIASSLLPDKPPKEGSFDWHAWRRACAEREAAMVHALVGRSS